MPDVINKLQEAIRIEKQKLIEIEEQILMAGSLKRQNADLYAIEELKF